MMKCWRLGDCGVTQGTKEQLIVTCSELLSAVRGKRYLWNLKIDAREEDETPGIPWLLLAPPAEMKTRERPGEVCS